MIYSPRSTIRQILYESWNIDLVYDGPSGCGATRSCMAVAFTNCFKKIYVLQTLCTLVRATKWAFSVMKIIKTRFHNKIKNEFHVNSLVFCTKMKITESFNSYLKLDFVYIKEHWLQFYTLLVLLLTCYVANISILTYIYKLLLRYFLRYTYYVINYFISILNRVYYIFNSASW
jgi:hypothetical protein